MLTSSISRRSAFVSAKAAVVVLFVAILAACGGGGGGGGGSASAPSTNTPAPSSPVLPPAPEFDLGSPAAVANIAGKVGDAAQAAPRAGSATQSSGANDSINVAVRAHSSDGITAVVGGLTLAAATRPDVDNVRVRLANNNADDKLATLGISLNPACPGETDFVINGRTFTGICHRYAESDGRILTAATHADGGFAVIATTGQMPVIIDGRTAAINYQTATITSSQFRSVNLFSRTDDGGLLYSRVYSDAVLSPSARRTVSFDELGVVTIHNAGGALILQNEEVHHSARTLQSSDSLAPSLTLNSSNNPEIGITIATPAPGDTVNIPVTLRKLERIVSTTLTGPKNGDSYRRNYLSGGFWMHAPANARSIADYEFGVFAGGSDELSGQMISPLAGVAVYRGEAAGVYASSRSGREEVLSFRANAVMTADFSSAELGVVVTGRVDGFVLANGTTLQNAAIDLGAAERANANTGLFSGDTGGGRFSGKWGGNFYGAPGRWTGNRYEDLIDGEVVQPDAVAATFGGASGDNSESIAGFIGARRISVAVVNASFTPYTVPPLRLGGDDIWQWRDSDYDDNRFFAARDGGGKLRAAGMRLGRLEFRHSRHSAPSALSSLAGGDSINVMPFFAAGGVDDVQMRLRFGEGFSGFAAHSDSYQQSGVLFSRDFGRVGIQSSFSRINEDDALFGKKWDGIAPLLRGGKSIQARAGMSFDINDKWSLFAAAEQAHTKAQTSGIIGRIDGLRAFGWRAGAVANHLFRHGDTLRFGLTQETSLSGGVAVLHLRQNTPEGVRIVERIVPLNAKKHHTLSAGYGFALSDNAKWSIAAAYRTNGKTRTAIQWQMKL